MTVVNGKDSHPVHRYGELREQKSRYVQIFAYIMLAIS